ncbi:MAG: hypothetical protein ACSHWZ_08435 [Sulfitobacter sp.]
MPISYFLLLILTVIVLAALTVWLISTLGPAAMAIALPLALIAAGAARKLRR